MCHPTVGSNSTPSGLPNLGCGEEGSFIQCKQLSCDAALLWEQHNWSSLVVSQLNCETAQLWGSPGVRTFHGYTAMLCSNPLCGLCSSLSGEMSRCFRVSQENLSLPWKGEVYALPYIETHPTPGPWLIYSYANEDSGSSQFDWFKRHSPNGQKEATLIGQWRCWWGGQYSCMSLIGWVQSQFYWLKYNYKNSFIRSGSDGRNTVQAGRQVSVGVQASPWSPACMRGPFESHDAPFSGVWPLTPYAPLSLSGINGGPFLTWSLYQQWDIDLSAEPWCPPLPRRPSWS